MNTKQLYGTVLLKADKIIDVLSHYKRCNLQEIAREAQLTNSTALKILETLIHIGYVEKNEDKTYQIGIKLIRLANLKLQELELYQISLPYLEKLRNNLNETVHLGYFAEDEVMYIHKLEPKNQSIRMTSKVGISRPLYSSAMGKAILAEMTDSLIEEYLQTHELQAFTPSTITKKTELITSLKQIQQTRVAFDDEEMEKDIYCVAVSLLKNAHPVGAISISFPKYRFDKKLLEVQIEALLNVKNSIEQKL